MTTFLENLKKYPILKKVGKKIVIAKECYFRLVSDDDFYAQYKKEFLLLDGCNDSKNSLQLQYSIGNLRLIKKPLQSYYDTLWDTITQKTKSKEGYTIVRVSDGEANFLRGIIKGNTASRHFTTGKQPTKEYISIFKQGLLGCDSIHIEMYKDMPSIFRKIYGYDVFSEIPFECIYALVSSRKIFNNTYKIGIIGADNKINIIKKLLEHEEYRSYVGRDHFDSYVSVPERGSTNDVETVYKSICEQMSPDIDIYLVGIGISKMAILSKLKENNKAVFIDVGCGISALAGLVSNDRPYFNNWVNFRLKGFDYSGLDTMDADMENGGVVYV
jgi:hypothetical protein